VSRPSTTPRTRSTGCWPRWHSRRRSSPHGEHQDRSRIGAGRPPSRSNSHAAAICSAFRTSVRTSPSLQPPARCTAVSLSRERHQVAPVRRRRSASARLRPAIQALPGHHGALDLEPGRELHPAGRRRDDFTSVEPAFATPRGRPRQPRFPRHAFDDRERGFGLATTSSHTGREQRRGFADIPGRGR
jgi:hypothetical protein